MEYRAEHVGSLLRPPELLQARGAHAEGRLNDETLRAAEDRAIADALRKQRELGLSVYSDGEMRRASWLTDMAEAVDGFVSGDRVMLEWKGPGGGAEATTASAVGAKLRKARKLTAHELPFLKKNAPGPFKITLPAPSNFMVASYKRGLTERFYPKHADLLRDLVAIIRDEVEWLVAEGVRYIQFDAPYYSHYLDPRQREAMAQQGRDPDEEFDLAIAGDNAAFAGLPRECCIVPGNRQIEFLVRIASLLCHCLALPRIEIVRIVRRIELDVAHALGHQPLDFVANDGHQIAQQVRMLRIESLGQPPFIARHHEVGRGRQRDLERSGRVFLQERQFVRGQLPGFP